MPAYFTRLAATVLVCLGSLALGASAETAAQYPSRSIRIIVGFAPGGGTDVLARIIGQALSKRLGQPVVVENRPGAQGAIAGAMVAQLPPDGYTLWHTAQGAMTVSPYIRNPKPYDPSDFAAISMTMVAALQIYVSKDFSAKTFDELVKLIKANPDKYSYATAGVGGPGHLVAESLSRKLGLKMVHVPYAGDGAAAPDVLSGRVPIWSTGMAGAHSHALSGGVRALVTASDKRLSLLPDTPTTKELGYDFEAFFYNAMVAPKGTPADIVKKLNMHIAEIYKDQAVLDSIKAMGIDPMVASPEDTEKYIQADIMKYKPIVEVIAASIAK